jgi:predicted ATPase
MWVNRVTVRAEDFPRRDCYPFDLGWLRERLELHFQSPITFFVGENGSGKSTLLEAIVLRADIPVWTNSKRHLAHRNPYENTLYEYVDLEWASGRVSGSFFNAETFRQRAEFLDDVSLVDPGQLKYFGGRTLLNQSHGEGMLTFFEGRYAIRGLYALDEPEAALSPASQLAFARMLHRYAAAGHAQFVIATHSPILLAVPGARLLALDRTGVREIAYEETEHYRLYRDFMADPRGALGLGDAAASAASASPHS